MIHLQVLNDIVRNKKDGTQVIIARRIKSSVWVKPEKIIGIVELIRNKHTNYKTRCEVIIDGVGNLIINKNPTLLLKELENNKIKGYGNFTDFRTKRNN